MKRADTHTVTLHDLTFACYLDEATIQQRVKEIGVALTEVHRENCPIFVGVLNGSVLFFSDLIKQFRGDCEVAFTRIASYEGLHSTGTIQHTHHLEIDLTGRHIIVIEDIIDTGRTMHYFLHHLSTFSPASVQMVSLLVKRDAMEFDIPIHHVGFEIPDRFVVGYGLDYNGLGRNLRAIYQKL